MIREKKIRINKCGEEVDGTISYFSPYLMKKRREAELPGNNKQVLLELKSFDIASTLIVDQEVLAEGRGYDHYDSFHCLQSQVEEEDTMILACGNCKFFLFSGMARDMSNGSRGYCLHGRLGQNLRPKDIREIFHCCNEFTFGPKAEREAYRRLWKTSLIERPLSERPRMTRDETGGSGFGNDSDRPPSQ
ncbi:MAG: hypothetical protein GY835_04555 [bacterium]|nr:hypothetical protein [bacterium]